MKKIYNKKSIMAYLLDLFFILINAKKSTRNLSNVKKHIDRQKNKLKTYKLPLYMGFGKVSYKKMDIYLYNEICSNKALVYFHGGTYTDQAGIYQLRFAKKIAKKTNSMLIFPAYPLAPMSNYKECQKLIVDFYKDNVYKKYDEINFLGDSAGGGLAIITAMLLKNKKMNDINNIIAMSPWVDLEMKNPKIKEDAKKDLICGYDGSLYSGKLWADGDNLSDFRLSPINGEFKNIGKITLCYGGREILSTICDDFSKVLDEKNIDYNLIKYSKMGHDFGAYPVKEGKMLISEIVSIMNETNI